MTPEEHIDKITGGRKTGFKVPEGYFEEFYASMPTKLPPRQEPPKVEMTTWQRIKPYVYLAAMFAGIWCMMKMFHLMSHNDISLDNPPTEVVAALNESPESFEEIVPEYAMSDFELEDSVSQQYESFDELSEDLGLELEPEYASIDVTNTSKEKPHHHEVAQTVHKK